MNRCRFRQLFGVALFAGALGLAGPPAFAVDALGLFELDGNAVEPNSTGNLPGDDWETLYNGGGSPNVFTGITSDPAPTSIFTGGRKDIQDIPQWGYKNGAVPDKSDITDAYAAAYDDNGDLIVYFGADRFDNNGDTFLGFWFFKSPVSLNGDGTFNGTHQPGDTLVLVNFPQATNAVPLIQVVTWDPTCTKADGPNPVPTQCAAQNLRLEAGASGAGAICSGLMDTACAITNEEGTANASPGADSTAPWPYTAKDGTIGQFPFETFFEGGINLSAIVGADACFTSFMAESRSSSSFTASLKDFVLDSFPVCAISVTKACANPRLNAAEDMITYDITGTVTNDGFGTVHNVNVTDSPAFDAGSLMFDGDPTSLAGGASIDYSATITVSLAENGTDDTVTATANTSSDGTGTTLSDTDTKTCPNLPISPALSITKDCQSAVTTLADPAVVVAQVDVFGQVCNVGDTRIDNVAVTDNKAGTLLSGISLKAPADPMDPTVEEGACADYSGTYTPAEANDVNGSPTTDPTAVVFKDSAEATGTDIFGKAVTPQSDMAACPLCQ
jgi:hypothetical protein